MAHAWESHDEATVDATVAEVWQAISTGPGLDSWFMGRNEVDGTEIRTNMGPFTMEATVIAAEAPHRFVQRIGEPDGRFVAYEYLVEGRDDGSTVLRVVASGFFPNDDWETEFEAMTLGGEMYFRTLVAYLDHFAGRVGTPVTASGPPVADWDAAWAAMRAAIGLGDKPAVGDPVRFEPAGLPAVEGVVDFVNRQALGIRTPDALYRFIQGFFGSMVIGHHLFSYGGAAPDQAWTAWLAENAA